MAIFIQIQKPSEEKEPTPQPTKSVNEKRYLNEIFEDFQKLPPGEQHFYLGEMKKLFQGRYQLISIEEPRFDPLKKFKGRPKGSQNKFKKISPKSSKRDPSGFEHQEQPRKRGRPRKTALNTKMGKGKKKANYEEKVCQNQIHLVSFSFNLI